MKDESTGSVCPYLGLSSDASLWRLAPTNAHRCYRWATPQTVELEHQESFCLSDGYARCPWFVRLDLSFSARRERPQPVDRRQRVLGAAGLVGVLLLVFVAVRALWGVVSPGEDESRVASGVSTPTATATATAARSAAPSPEPTPQAASPTLPPTPQRTAIPAPATPGSQPTTLPVAQQPTVAPSPIATLVPTAAATRAAASPTPAPPRATAASATPAPEPTLPPGYQHYEIEEGDTLYGLARSFGVTVEEIMRANGLTDRGLVRVGQKLLIPPPER